MLPLFYSNDLAGDLTYICPSTETKNNAVLTKTKFYEFAQRRSDRPGHGKQAGSTFGKAARRTRRE